jgi:hypothetical protein
MNLFSLRALNGPESPWIRRPNGVTNPHQIIVGARSLISLTIGEVYYIMTLSARTFLYILEILEFKGS